MIFMTIGISEATGAKNASLVSYESDDTGVTLSEDEDNAAALRKKAKTELNEGKN